MNISAGGPQILLFERDQQLAALLTSEFQLAGYECRTARTAVEVFDAIARYSIRLVLVNLAQAAASRREFWVALDTQRRGRGVQVITFHCTNIAGYGPRDPDEQPHNTMVDVEVDSMLGVINLVEAVRTRIPGSTGSMTSTMPRLTKAVVPPPPPTQSTIPQITTQRPPSPEVTNVMLPGGNSWNAPSENVINQQPFRASSIKPPQPYTSAPKRPIPQPGPTLVPQPPSATMSGTPSYTDKICAVLYPNQRTWSSSGSTNGNGNGNGSAIQESRVPSEVPATSAPPADSYPVPLSPAGSTILQRLANGMDELKESSLDQLSRLVQGRWTPPVEEIGSSSMRQSTGPTQSVEAAPMASYMTVDQPFNSTSVIKNAPMVSRPAQSSEQISNQLLRASPIQDLPTAGGSTSGRYPDILANTSYGQPLAISPLASISTAMSAPARMQPPPQPEKVKEEQRQMNQQVTTTNQLEQQLTDKKKTNSDQTSIEQRLLEEMQRELIQSSKIGANGIPDNALLLDILQSLPPMPSPSQQVQPVVLNGRATRSLGSVLLEGHLIPQSRLEVAQSIQRMLRGVDLNYQLGEILLMFKLLTPDQLLAASLVSYGLINTTQIGALGRIRQELHSIGLEYDLENFLILFRILTPEQLREVRAAWQG